MYTNAQYLYAPGTTEVSYIGVEINGIYSIVPFDIRNTDYQEITRLIEIGELVIAPAEE